MTQQDRFIDIGFRMHLREWLPLPTNTGKPPFLLVHGLASNARTWDEVAKLLAAAGHPAVAIDQRGHGRSQKPEDGYDFATITQDLRLLLDKLGWLQPILAGQSWGGNVLLEFGARFPGVARKLIFVDGGFLDLQQRGAWKTIATELRPPNLNGTPRNQIAARIKQRNPSWSPSGVEATLHNFETLPDGTIRPWLTLERHMRILRAMYEQKTAALYPQVQEPVLICVADDGSEWATRKRAQVKAAAGGLRRAEVAWFPGAAHDIHIDQPVELAARFLDFSK
jgi:pimeloyl-ACP methyl ester carboxylesterase